jgi:hypothetical protein
LSNDGARGSQPCAGRWEREPARRQAVQMCPLSCPPARANPAAEPKRAGIIIRVSGVRVPPPACEAPAIRPVFALLPANGTRGINLRVHREAVSSRLSAVSTIPGGVHSCPPACPPDAAARLPNEHGGLGHHPKAGSPRGSPPSSFGQLSASAGPGAEGTCLAAVSPDRAAAMASLTSSWAPSRSARSHSAGSARVRACSTGA